VTGFPSIVQGLECSIATLRWWLSDGFPLNHTPQDESLDHWLSLW
jgi:hypothetical protein